jgi:hypothetical protein
MEAVVANFNAWLLDISGGTEENYRETQSQQAVYGRRFESELKYEAGLLHTELRPAL